MSSRLSCCLFFFFNHTATTEIYTLSLHDALPILPRMLAGQRRPGIRDMLEHQVERILRHQLEAFDAIGPRRSEEHTSELQSHSDLVCRLLLEKKKKQ